MDIKNRISSLAAVLMIIGFMTACADWDEYKEYTKDGEIVYPGKLSLLNVRSGENRVSVNGTLGADARVVSYRIYWNDYRDSLSYEVNDEIRFGAFENIIEVSEGLRTFVVHTYDEFGNESGGVSDIGVAYGENYRAKINNKSIASVGITDSSTFLVWSPFDLSTGAQTVHVQYEVDGEMSVVQSPAGADTTVLPGLVASDTVTYYTVFLPDADCIDEFLTETRVFAVNR